MKSVLRILSMTVLLVTLGARLSYACDAEKCAQQGSQCVHSEKRKAHHKAENGEHTGQPKAQLNVDAMKPQGSAPNSDHNGKQDFGRHGRSAMARSKILQ